MATPTPAEGGDDVVQMNVRLPRSVRDAVDAHRAPDLLSRDKWVQDACERKIAIENAPRRPYNNSAGRTTPPPHRR